MTPTMPQALLTLLVPTYNRARQLDLLLRTLHAEVGEDTSVRVLVSDNASTDDTAAVISAACEAWPALRAQRHASNIGADGNFCSCVDRVETRHFWILGDDDLPKSGVIGKVVALLRETAPALIYMQSEWLNPVTGPDQGEPVDALRVEALDAVAFARRVHVWFTFISGVIVDRTQLASVLGEHTIRRFTATNLVQLGWVLPLLGTGARFLFIENRCVLATKDNTGGYALLTVFGVNFARVVNEAFGRNSRMARILIGANILHYLPGLTWGARTAPSGRHDAEDAWPAMRRELGRRPLFWLLLVPLGRFPNWLAQPFYQAWRIFHRLNRELHKRRAGPALQGRRP